jgi:hypothetical protein
MPTPNLLKTEASKTFFDEALIAMLQAELTNPKESWAATPAEHRDETIGRCVSYAADLLRARNEFIRQDKTSKK